jgi:hypothetical protein
MKSMVDSANWLIIKKIHFSLSVLLNKETKKMGYSEKK